jgi:hypothetical protein
LLRLAVPKWLPTTRVRRSCRNRAPLVLFGVVEIVAVPLLLWFGRGGWFVFDEWDLLAQRTGGNLGDLFRPHYQHWLTLPILAYRLLWQLFGIRTYLPYQLLSILVHLAAATLLLVVMRRAGVTAWLSTILACAFVFFGTGADNILLGFLIAFVGSLVFGLMHLMLADHDGPVDRRDWLGLLAGLAGMLCSGVAVTMVIVVGLAALLRRGWRTAVFHTAPLGGAYLIWLAIIGRHQNQHLPLEHPSASEVLRFIAVGLRATFGGLGRLPGVGLALALVLLTGLAISFVQLGRESFRQRAAAPIALLAGAIIFLAITATGRAGHTTFRLGISGPEYARQGRYVYLVAAMTLPALALASDAIVRRWRPLAAVVLILPLLGVPGNLERFVDYRRSYKALDFVKDGILLAPRVPLAAQLPRSIEPDGFHAPGLTLGWLIDGVRSGRVPPPPPATSTGVATETLRLALARTNAAQVAPCEVLPGPVLRVLNKGQSITLKTATVRVVYLPPASAPSRPVTFRKLLSSSVTLLALVGPLRLRVIVPAGVVSCG